MFNIYQVIFVGEGAIDQGGPKREFFRLFAKAASEVYFRGDATRAKYMANNITAFQVIIAIIKY